MSGRIYLAGPDVFYRNASDRFARLRALCARCGCEGVAPADADAAAAKDEGARGAHGDELAEEIYRRNIELLRGCDAVLANLQPFRGMIEPDSGTVFEVGFAIALGKPVAGYLPRVDEYHEYKIAEAFGRETIDGLPYDRRYGFMIESLGQPMNLMLARSVSLHEDAWQAVSRLARALER